MAGLSFFFREEVTSALNDTFPKKNVILRYGQDVANDFLFALRPWGAIVVCPAGTRKKRRIFLPKQLLSNPTEVTSATDCKARDAEKQELSPHHQNQLCFLGKVECAMSKPFLEPAHLRKRLPHRTNFCFSCIYFPVLYADNNKRNAENRRSEQLGN